MATLLELSALGLVCGSAGLTLGVTGMAFLFVLTGNSKWARLRRRFRPTLWYLGLDWPEVQRTWKRAFMTCYAQGLPDSQPAESQLNSLGDEPVDESDPASRVPSV